MSVCPTSATTAIMRYDVYRRRGASDEQFIAMDKFFKQVEEEDKELCNGAQVNLNIGTYGAGELQPCAELGVLHFQHLVREAVMAHHKQEEKKGKEIWPTRLASDRNEDMEFCSALESCTNGIKAADW
jgi:hypothetical protein